MSDATNEFNYCTLQSYDVHLFSGQLGKQIRFCKCDILRLIVLKFSAIALLTYSILKLSFKMCSIFETTGMDMGQMAL